MSDSGKKVAFVLANNYEDIEHTSPVDALKQAGAEITVIGLSKETITGKKGGSEEPDATFDDVRAEDFDMLVIPGGGSPENLRIDDRAVAFTKAFVETGKPVASICHGPQLLISADVVKDRTVTAVNKIRDDIKNAGGNYVDKAVVVDGNLISSRVPSDLHVFNEALVKALK
jgi:protease I